MLDEELTRRTSDTNKSMQSDAQSTVDRTRKIEEVVQVQVMMEFDKGFRSTG